MMLAGFAAPLAAGWWPGMGTSLLCFLMVDGVLIRAGVLNLAGLARRATISGSLVTGWLGGLAIFTVMAQLGYSVSAGVAGASGLMCGWITAAYVCGLRALRFGLEYGRCGADAVDG